MTKEKLIETINRILDTDTDLKFLLQLDKNDLENLIACIRVKRDALKILS